MVGLVSPKVFCLLWILLLLLVVCFVLFCLRGRCFVLFENLSNVMVVILKDMYDQVAVGHILLKTD